MGTMILSQLLYFAFVEDHRQSNFTLRNINNCVSEDIYSVSKDIYLKKVRLVAENGATGIQEICLDRCTFGSN